MKIITLLLFFSFTYSINAQDLDPDLFNQTWYLHEVFESDDQNLFIVEGYQPYGNPQIPQIMPYVYIEPDLSFIGQGICNTFNGTLVQEPTPSNILRAVTSNVTSNSCGFFEDMVEPNLIGPFGYVTLDFYTIFNVNITSDSDGFQTLSYTSPPFVQYAFRNTPVLSVDEFTPSQCSMYPNPVKEVLNFSCEKGTMESISIFSVTGSKVLQLSIDSSNSINVSSLDKGLYFVEITYLEGKEVKKIIKN